MKGLWKRISELKITRFLRMGYGSKILLDQQNAAPVEIDLQELAAVNSIGAADLAKIDGITNGTGAAGKALVLDANGDVTMPTGGEITNKAGDGTETYVAEGTIDVQTTKVGNAATTTETTLMTYSVPPNTLSANGKGVYVKAWGTFAGNAQNKQVKLKAGGLTFASGSSTQSGASWSVEGTFVRAAANTQRAIFEGTIGSTQLANAASDDTSVDTSTITVQVTCLSGSGSQSDVIQSGMIVRYF